MKVNEGSIQALDTDAAPPPISNCSVCSEFQRKRKTWCFLLDFRRLARCVALKPRYMRKLAVW
jgi:hypothetical protein